MSSLKKPKRSDQPSSAGIRMDNSKMTLPDSTHKAQPQAVALFISDVHLQASMPQTAQAFLDFLRYRATKAKQLYLLGDLFEYWAGDDDIGTAFNQQIVDAIRQVNDAGVAIFWMAGNRDFLVSDTFSRATGAILLPDPYVTTLADQRIVLTHGDAQCTDDEAYMAFRAQVRGKEWQQKFLAMPLEQRKAIIDGLRKDSQEAQRSKSYEIMDVNAGAISSLFGTSDASIMIHGHTHRPARHEYHEHHHVRYVLPDWDCDVPAPRGGWISLTSDGAIRRFGINGEEVL
jgi:UDP-2,3-diacylglucosamine hydrolase